MRAWLALLTLGMLGCGAFAAPGRACRKQEECAGLKNGYCSKAEICTRECSESDPCPESATCSQQGARAVCLPTCSQDSQCLSNFVCYGNVCVLAAPLEPPPI